jgi:hypothetical protein
MATDELHHRRASKIACAVASCIVGITFGIGIYFGNLQYSIGQVSLTGYCSSQHLEISGTYCAQPIDLNAVCNWQYKSDNLHAEFTSRDPYSMICYDSALSILGGISNLSGYCQAVTGATSAVAAVGNPDYKDVWVCQEAINIDVACISQYNMPGLRAGLANGIWVCYRSVFLFASCDAFPRLMGVHRALSRTEGNPDPYKLPSCPAGSFAVVSLSLAGTMNTRLSAIPPDRWFG